MDTPWSSYNTTESARENWSVIADFVKNRKKISGKKVYLHSFNSSTQGREKGDRIGQ